MSTVQLEPTVTAQWHRLVTTALRECGIRLDESVEAYLIFMLMRFAERTDVGRHALALEFLEGVQGAFRGHGAERLRDTGDECLLVCGLFPQRVRRRSVPFRYYVDLGRGAYGTLASAGAASNAEPFEALSAGFVTLMEVLQAMRADHAEPLLSPVEAAEVAVETGSRRAWERIAPSDATLVTNTGDPSVRRRH